MRAGREVDLFPMSKEQYKNASPEERKFAWRQYNAKKNFRRGVGKPENKFGGY